MRFALTLLVCCLLGIGCGVGQKTKKKQSWTWLTRNSSYPWKEYQAPYGDGKTLDVSLPVDLKPTKPEGAFTLRFKGPIDEVDILITTSPDVMNAAEKLGKEWVDDELTVPERLKSYTIYQGRGWEQPQGDKDPDGKSEPIVIDGVTYHSSGTAIMIPTSHTGQSLTVCISSNEESGDAGNVLQYLCDWIAAHNEP
jgi:hypothetical protein